MFTAEQLTERGRDLDEFQEAWAIAFGGLGEVEVLNRSDDSWTAHAQSSGPPSYVVNVDAKLASTCSCFAWMMSGKQGAWCKHASALALIWLKAEGEVVNEILLTEAAKHTRTVSAVVMGFTTRCGKVIVGQYRDGELVEVARVPMKSPIERADLMQNPDRAIGKVVSIRTFGAPANGRLRSPNWVGWGGNRAAAIYVRD